MTYKIENQIESYLNGNYPFALMINGKWGSGKTYYLKNVLEKNLKDISKGSLKSLCYVSCNGVRSIDELKNNLTLSKLSSYTSLSESKINKAKKIKDGILNFLPETISGLVSIGLKDIDLINTTDLLIIDDLERRHSDLTIQEILGFVSVKYTELNEIKVILVADEEELLNKLVEEKQKAHYLTIKEKTIYRTIDFDENLSELFNSIIENLKDSKYQALLKEKSEFILRRCKVYEEKNLRTIGFFIDSLKILFEKFSNELRDDTDNVIINSLLMLCIMYKKGEKFYENGKIKEFYKIENYITQLNWKKPSSSEVLVMSENETTDKNYLIFNNYLKDSKKLYAFFSSIFTVIEFGIFDPDIFNEEYKIFYKRYDSIKPWNLLLERFRDIRVYSTDDEFDTDFRNIKSFICENRYSVNQLIDIAYNYETYKVLELIRSIDDEVFYQSIKESINKRSDSLFSNDYSQFYIEEISKKITNANFLSIKNYLKSLESEQIKKFHTDNIELYLKEYRKFGILDEQQFQIILSSASETQIAFFCDLVLVSNKHLDTFCDKLSKKLMIHYRHTPNFKVNIDFIITSLEDKTYNMRIPKLRIIEAIKVIKG